VTTINRDVADTQTNVCPTRNQRLLITMCMTAIAYGMIAGVFWPAASRAEATMVSVRVRTADLDLGTAKGMVALDRRLSRAAREACGVASAADAMGWKRTSACIDAARASAHGLKAAVNRRTRAADEATSGRREGSDLDKTRP
jgi:UrcA family protein